MLTLKQSNSAKTPTPKAPTSEPKQLSEIALIGIYEVSKILAKPARLETTLSNVLNLLSSFLDMQHGTIVLLDDDDVPGIVVCSAWTEAVQRGIWHGAVCSVGPRSPGLVSAIEAIDLLEVEIGEDARVLAARIARDSNRPGPACPLPFH